MHGTSVFRYQGSALLVFFLLITLNLIYSGLFLYFNLSHLILIYAVPKIHFCAKNTIKILASKKVKIGHFRPFSKMAARILVNRKLGKQADSCTPQPPLLENALFA